MKVLSTYLRNTEGSMGTHSSAPEKDGLKVGWCFILGCSGCPDDGSDECAHQKFDFLQ